MDLRRALTAAAATAVLMPVVLVTAATGYAAPGSEGEGPPGSGPSAVRTSETAPTAPPSGSPAPSGTGTVNPAPTPTGSPSATEPTTTEPSASAPSVTAPSATTQPTLEGEVTPTPGDLPTGTPGSTASSSPPPGDDADRDRPNGVCDVADFDVHIEGLPATVPAGSTTRPFTVVLDNSAGGDAAHVQFGLSVAFREGQADRDWLAAQHNVGVRYFDWATEAWDDELTDGGIYTYADLEAGKRYEMRLRLVLTEDAPPGAAGALAFSTKWTFDRAPGGSACVYDNEWYRFEITPAGTAPAAAQVRPQGGRAPHALDTADHGTRTVEAAFAEGALARTGPGPELPVLVLASAGAITLGACALVVAARRRT